MIPRVPVVTFIGLGRSVERLCVSDVDIDDGLSLALAQMTACYVIISETNLHCSHLAALSACAASTVYPVRTFKGQRRNVWRLWTEDNHSQVLRTPDVPDVPYNVTTCTCYNITKQQQLECGPMPIVMAALPNIGGALCSAPQFG